jgi:6-phosphogluconolactonase
VSGRLVVVPDAEELARTGADVLARLIATAANERGACSVALAGGSTPRPVYAALAKDPRLPWDRVDWYFGDERAVAPDHPESNWRLAAESLFRARPGGEVRAHRMEADAADLDGAARRYGRALPARLDVLVLGMGPDGHVASLFPGSPALAESVERVVAVTGPKPPNPRLTLTPPVIAGAREIVVLVAGAEKAAMVARALDGPADAKSVPARLAREGTWIVDQAAAALVRKP